MQMDSAKLRTLKISTEEQSKVVNAVVDSLVGKYNSELTALVSEIREIMRSDREVSTQELEKWVMQLPALMYFTGTGMEMLGTESDTASAVKREIYNEALDKAEGTIPDKKGQAESVAFNEIVIEKAFARAYKRIQRNMVDAEHLFSGLKKVITKRVEENLVLRREI